MRNGKGGERPEQIRSLGRDSPCHRRPPVVPDQMHGTETSELDEPNDVLRQLRGAIRATRAGASAR
jgi:hypothetical protein